MGDSLITNAFDTWQAACVTIAALMQYFLMAAFCWMLVEGIYLYLYVVKVYNINDNMGIYHVLSWGMLPISADRNPERPISVIVSVKLVLKFASNHVFQLSLEVIFSFEPEKGRLD